MILRFGIGILLGLFFYGGLWLTVNRLATTNHPVLLSLGSLMVRMGVALAGFYILIDGRWQNAIAAVLGFSVGRVVLSWSGRRSLQRRSLCT
jgi:F1F0 ATPase subunit 2